MKPGKVLVIDNNIAWIIVHGPHSLGKPLHDFIIGLKHGEYIVAYTHVNILDLDKKNTLEARRVIDWLRKNLYGPMGPSVKTMIQIISRYNKWIKKIGLADVMLAYSAKTLKAVLVTGDWAIARLYMDLVGDKRYKPLFIPIKILVGREEK